DVGQVAEDGMLVPGATAHEQPDAVARHAARLGWSDRGGTDAAGGGEDIVDPHAASSHASPCAAKRRPEVRTRSCPRSQAKNGNVASGSGRSEMSSPG